MAAAQPDQAKKPSQSKSEFDDDNQPTLAGLEAFLAENTNDAKQSDTGKGKGKDFIQTMLDDMDAKTAAKRDAKGNIPLSEVSKRLMADIDTHLKPEDVIERNHIARIKANIHRGLYSDIDGPGDSSLTLLAHLRLYGIRGSKKLIEFAENGRYDD